MNLADSLAHFGTELILAAGGCAVLFTDLLFKNRKANAYAALAVIAGAALFLRLPDSPMPLFGGFFMLDGFTHFFRILALGATAAAVVFSLDEENLPQAYLAEYYSILLFTGFGLVLMAASSNLLMIFLAIEFVSVLSYILAGFFKNDAKSKEASLKYLLFGSACSGFMLYGMSILYGLTGSLELETIGAKMLLSEHTALASLSLLLILAGIGFKISMAPFHMWAPDVYEGAPTPVTAFLTVAPKALGFAVLMRVLSISFSGTFPFWTQIILFLSILTMTIGNILALAQDNIKRLLGYSSIAQAGYILMGIAVFSQTGLQAVLFYVMAYAFTNLGAFAVVMILSINRQSEDIHFYAGLGRRSPLLAASLTLFLLSLAGIPPLAGYVGKFMVFAGAIQAHYYLLAAAAAINSAIAAFYYFKIVRLMYLVPAAEGMPSSIRIGNVQQAALYIMLAGTVLFGLIPMPLLRLVGSALPGN